MYISKFFKLTIFFNNIAENLRKERMEVHRQNKQGRSSVCVTKAMKYIRIIETTNEEISVFIIPISKFLLIM
jgi:hypothetical protein